MAGDVRLIRSPVSVVGMVLTTVSAVLFLTVLLADLFGLHTNPYVGVLFFLVFPAIFLLGLALIPLGAWYERRRRAAGKAPSELSWPRIDLNVPRQRQLAVAVFALTMANVVIVSLAAYRGIEYMDSVAFCGQVCHEPMKPEFTAHQDAPHSGVACVSCHVGPGAASLVSAKVAGIRRVVARLFGELPAVLALYGAEQPLQIRHNAFSGFRAGEPFPDQFPDFFELRGPPVSLCDGPLTVILLRSHHDPPVVGS